MYYLLLTTNKQKNIIEHHADKTALLNKMKQKIIIYESNDEYTVVPEKDDKMEIYKNCVQKGYIYNTNNAELMETYEVLSYNMEKKDNCFGDKLQKQKKKLKASETAEIKVVNIFDELRNNMYFQKLRINVEL